ncbi:MAG: hypothetical protein G8345_20370 [Magnetococcales bacterium]|nr:hypothetical protein [Magnetococcales bacterium]
MSFYPLPPQLRPFLPPAVPPPAHLPDQQEACATREETPILCKFCSLVITRPQEAIVMAGSHEHTFFNPAGMVYRIGCFRTATGCTWLAESSADFSWFPQTLWQIALCRRCHSHLGWRYTTSLHSTFFGLILTRLTYPQPRQENSPS